MKETKSKPIRKKVDKRYRSCNPSKVFTIERRKIMKKIVSFLLLCLILCVVQFAFAEQSEVYGQEIIEQIASVYDEYGEYETWPLEGYMKAEQLLYDNGVLREIQLSASDTRSSWDISQALLDRLPGVSSHLIKRVAISVWGVEDLWTMENAYWYTETLKAHDLLVGAAKIYMLPGDGIVSIEEAKQTAQSYVMQRYNVDLQARTDVDTYYTYFTPSESEPPRWKVVFAVQYTRQLLFAVEVSDSGEVINSSMFQETKEDHNKWADFVGYIFELSMEEKAEYAQQFTTPMYGFPDSTHIQGETAKQLASEALAGEGVVVDSNKHKAYLSFVISGKEELSYPYWTVDYTDVETGRWLYYVAISATNGEVLKIQIMDWDNPGQG